MDHFSDRFPGKATASASLEVFPAMQAIDKTTVLIIGGGATGTGLARDLSLRGVPCVLVEKHDLNAGASGGNHGLLHSGARYVASDSEAARECREEGRLLRRMAGHCIEDTGGLFVAVQGDDERYIADFPAMCGQCGIPVEALDPREARGMEPGLAPGTVAAYAVADAVIDPFRLSLQNMADAQRHGARILRYTQVCGFRLGNGQIRSVRLVHAPSGDSVEIEALQVVNATGAWAGGVAALAGIEIPMVYSKGSLLVTQERIARRVINRLRRPTDGDILVPGGTVSILGTTSMRIPCPDGIAPTVEEVDRIIEEGAAMLPVLAATRYIRAYCGVRPLVSLSTACDDRCVSRGFVLIDHAPQGIGNFTTITGGKLTTFRLMAEKTADLVCAKLGVSAPCRTRTEPLPVSAEGHWTEPGIAPKQWLRGHAADDRMLCECEMVPASAVDQILETLREAGAPSSLEALGRRSRIGKGPCQGTFCSLRIAAHLHNRGCYSGGAGAAEIRAFARERWKGLQALLWEMPLVQAELQEALLCGFLGLEAGAPPRKGPPP
jgi:glycerol-3-phosphate dehydrogenase